MRISKRAEYFLSIAVVVACATSSVLLRNRLALENFVIFYIFGVMTVSACCSRGPALTNALLSVISFHYFSLPPFDSFRSEHPAYVVTLFGMLSVSLVITTLTTKIRNQALEAQRREDETKHLFRLREE